MNSAAKESRRRQRLLQAQVGALCEERADFLARLLDQNREIGTLRKGLGLAQKENEDLTKFQVQYLYIYLILLLNLHFLGQLLHVTQTCKFI